MILVKTLLKDNAIMADESNVENKFRNLCRDGYNKLMVIADFDSTLTKSIVDGKPTAHTLDIFSQTRTLSQAYRVGCATLLEKYDPQVNDPDLTDAQKQQLLDQWWIDHEMLTVGEKVTVADVLDSAENINTPLRDGCGEMLSLLSDHQVPLIVVSAGLGEVIEYALRGFKPTIVSNFLIHDETSRILGFTKPTVSIYNKHRMSYPLDETRHNVILLGDSLGDCNMGDGIPNTQTVLKIGFFSGKDEKKLEMYRSCYDIVLLDDQTMDTVSVLLKLIVGAS